MKTNTVESLWAITGASWKSTMKCLKATLEPLHGGPRLMSLQLLEHFWEELKGISHSPAAQWGDSK